MKEKLVNIAIYLALEVKDNFKLCIIHKINAREAYQPILNSYMSTLTFRLNRRRLAHYSQHCEQEPALYRPGIHE